MLERQALVDIVIRIRRCRHALGMHYAIELALNRHGIFGSGEEL